MNKLELVVKQEIGAITTNFEEIKANLEADTKEYLTAIVDEVNKTERKKDIANLRKKLVEIKDKKAEVKNECLKPYLLFEAKANELVEIINTPIGILDNQVKELDERNRLEKKMEIQQIFDEIIEPLGDLIEDISLENIYDKKWDNVATSIKSIREDISNKLATINQGMTVLKASLSEKKEEALNLYLLDFDLARAMNHINKYEQQKVEILERQQRQLEEQKKRELEMEREIIRREESEKLRKEEAFKQEERRKSELAIEQAREEERVKAVEQEEKIREEERAIAQQEIINDLTPISEETTMLYEYRIELGEDSKKKLELYMDSVGIEWEEI